MARLTPPLCVSLACVQAGAHGFVIVGESDGGPAGEASTGGVANGAAPGGYGAADDMGPPPDFDAMPTESFEPMKPAAAATAMDVGVEGMDVD